MKGYTDEQLAAAIAEVRVALDLGRLQKRCYQNKATLFRSLHGEMRGAENAQHSIRVVPKSRILMVAHLDTVQQTNAFGVVRYPGETLVFNPKLDDRLGAYTILDLLPKLGIVEDVLLSDNEERGATTAADFKTDKKYGWIVSFDRRGEDAVTYRYTWDAVLRDYFTVGHGSFSCIDKMGGLGCQGVNIGVGYHNEHGLHAYFVLEQYIRQVARFLLFYRRYRTVRFTYENRFKQSFGRRHEHEGIKRCASCKVNPVPFDNVALCETCFTRLDRENASRRAKAASISKSTAVIASAGSTNSKRLMLDACPTAVAFCEVCWLPRLSSNVNILHDSIACRDCGQIVEGLEDSDVS